MLGFPLDDIRDLFFLALRLLAAAGGFLAGWFLAGPLAQVLIRLAFHRVLPPSAKFAIKLTGGVLLGMLVFWFLPLGFGGGGGGGRGGGTGKGIGPGTDQTGNSKSPGKGPGEGTGKAGPVVGEKPVPGKNILTIELLESAAVKEEKYYLLAGKGPPVDAAGVKKYLEEHRSEIDGIDFVFAEQGVGPSHRAFQVLKELADKQGLRSRPVPPKERK